MARTEYNKIDFTSVERMTEIKRKWILLQYKGNYRKPLVRLTDNVSFDIKNISHLIAWKEKKFIQ
jgi:hypothetical protein